MVEAAPLPSHSGRELVRLDHPPPEVRRAYSRHVALITVNGVDLAVEESGAGEPLVLLHGSWVDRTGWVFVEEELAQSYHVVTYDRRGHSASPRVPGTRRDDEDDLAALIEHLGLGPAHVVGTSSGASITLGLAARRPDVVRSLCVHEPPLTGLCADDPVVRAGVEDPVHNRVLPLIERGEDMAAAQVFINDVALGAGAWALVPPESQALMANNAATFAEEMRDPGFTTLDLTALATSTTPMSLTYGGQSPPFFEKVVDVLRTSVPQIRVTKIDGAGHSPHITNAPEWLTAVRTFIDGT